MTGFEQLFDALCSAPGREATLRQARNPLIFDAKVVGARPSMVVVAGPILAHNHDEVRRLMRRGYS